MKKFIAAELRKACANVCYEDSTDETPFPYIVYFLEHVKSEVGYDYSLEINIWDKNKSTKQVEAIADQLEEILDCTYFNADSFTVVIDLNTRNIIKDEDRSLKRRRLLFDLSYFN